MKDLFVDAGHNSYPRIIFCVGDVAFFFLFKSFVN